MLTDGTPSSDIKLKHHKSTNFISIHQKIRRFFSLFLKKTPSLQGLKVQKIPHFRKLLAAFLVPYVAVPQQPFTTNRMATRLLS